MNGFITGNLARIERRIDKACKASGRHRAEIKLLLATKTVTAAQIGVAVQAGYTLIGENKVQEIRDKFEALKETTHDCHFIGHLQTNKIREVLKYGVSCVQSLDRPELARKLHGELQRSGKTLDVLVQVNTSYEQSKFGVHPREVTDLIKQVAPLATLRIKGLMTIGMLSADPGKARQCFRLLRDIRQEVIAARIPGVAMHDLSMGMSGDLEAAIEEGATILRVGTAVFGQRPTPDSYYWNESAP